ncbi:MAG: VanZ family protein [Phycisphaerales bacterium]
MSDSPRRSWRVAFALYAATLFTATHWPRLEVPMVVPRSDLYVHAGVFGVWTGLAIACGFFGPRLSRTNILATGLLGIAYAALDEALQAIPVLHRTAAFDDWAADCLGGVLVSIVALVLSRKVTHA